MLCNFCNLYDTQNEFYFLRYCLNYKKSRQYLLKSIQDIKYINLSWGNNWIWELF